MENNNIRDSVNAKEAFELATRDAILKKVGSKLLNEEFNRQANAAQWEFLEIDEVVI